MTSIAPTFRSRSGSDPGRLPSSISPEDNDGNIAALNEQLAALEEQQERMRWVFEGAMRENDARGEDIVNGVVVNTKTSRAKTGVDGPKGEENGHQKPKPKPRAAKKAKVKQAVAVDVRDISDLSAPELKALSDPDQPHVKVAVISPDIPNAKPQIIHKSYPLALLVAMSPKVAAAVAARDARLRAGTDPAQGSSSKANDSHHRNDLRSTPALTTTDSSTKCISPLPPVGVVLHSSAPLAITTLLSYTLLSSTHSSLHSETARSTLSISLSSCAFYKYARIHDEAVYLGFESLKGMMMSRLKRIAGGQVHTNDVERILTNVSGEPGAKGGWIREMMVDSIARALREGRLWWKWKYDALREQYPEFDAEIGAKIEALKEMDRSHNGQGADDRGSAENEGGGDLNSAARLCVRQHEGKVVKPE